MGCQVELMFNLVNFLGAGEAGSGACVSLDTAGMDFRTMFVDAFHLFFVLGLFLTLEILLIGVKHCLLCLHPYPCHTVAVNV